MNACVDHLGIFDQMTMVSIIKKNHIFQIWVFFYLKDNRTIIIHHQHSIHIFKFYHSNTYI